MMEPALSPEEIERLLDQFMPYIVVNTLIASVVSLLLTVLFVVTFCKLFHKTGRHWALGFLALLPLGWLIMLMFLAFGRWPVLEELAALKAAAGPPSPPHPVTERPLS